MRWKGVVCALGLCGKCLQADEQIRINRGGDLTDYSDENPKEPDRDILLLLEKRRVLFLFENLELKGKYTRLLKDFNKPKVLVGDQVTQMTNFENYDSVVAVGKILRPSKQMPVSGISAKSLINRYDSRFHLPFFSVNERINRSVLDMKLNELHPKAAWGYRDRKASENFGPSSRLPFSFLIFYDSCNDGEKTCKNSGAVCEGDGVYKSLAKQMGLNIDDSKAVCDEKATHAGSSHVRSETNDGLSGMVHNGVDVSTIHGTSVSWNRGAWVSSISLCDDDHYNQDSSFCQNLLDWTFHKQAVVTWANLRHFRLDEEQVEHNQNFLVDKFNTFDQKKKKKHNNLNMKENESRLQSQIPNITLSVSTPYLYRIRDQLLAAVDLYEISRDSANGPLEWKPLKSPLLEMQYQMMVPYVRRLALPVRDRNLLLVSSDRVDKHTHTIQGHTHVAQFQAPQQHGIFKITFKSLETINNEMRPFNKFNPIYLETIAPLRTFKHDQIQRFPLAGIPYALNLAIATGVFLFVCWGLLHGERKKTEKSA